MRSFRSAARVHQQGLSTAFPSTGFRGNFQTSSGDRFIASLSKPISSLAEQLPECPEHVLAIDVNHRPLIPGFYKTLSITDPITVAAVQALVRRERGRAPLVGVFLTTRDVKPSKTSSENNEVATGSADQGTKLDTNPTLDPLPFFSVGTLCTIVSSLPTGGGAPLTLVVYPHYRIETKPNMSIEAMVDETVAITEPLPSSSVSSECHPQISHAPGPVIVRIQPLAPPHTDSTGPERALAQECVTLLGALAKSNAFIREHLASFTQPLPSVDDSEALADLIAVLCAGPPQSLQQILASNSMEERLRIALELLLRESESTQLLIDIRRSVEERLASRHREALLQEQLRAIQRELGGTTGQSRPIGESLRERALALFESRIAPLRPKLTTSKAPTDASTCSQAEASSTAIAVSSLLAPNVPALLQLVDEEMERLASVDPSSGEFGIIRTYLDWLTALPWLSGPPVIPPSLGEARAILDADHWGLTDVKQRIIEMLASIHLQGQGPPTEGSSLSRSVLLLVGPPGIGKTSIAASIARALGRPFYRLSLGGLTDVAEIKGHRRTYLGAMPGKLVQALRQTKSHAPVILLDEIDKVGMTTMGGRTGGDPGAALLEALDGRHFVDYFLDTPIDLSGVIFLATANQTESITAPLLDRMSIIRLSSYVTAEKIVIAQRHLLPQALKATGLSRIRIASTNESISTDKSTSDNISPFVVSNESSQDRNENKPSDVAIICQEPAVELSKTTLQALIDGWCREPGVRQLRQCIERICRRMAATVLEHPETTLNAALNALHITEKTPMIAKATAEGSVIISSPIHVGIEALPPLLGLAPFSSELGDFGGKLLPPGVVAGLAWTSYGGIIIHIEVARVGGEIEQPPSKSGDEPNITNERETMNSSLALPLKTTGHLGKVMDESAAIAHSVVRMALATESTMVGSSANVMATKKNLHGALHLHVPEGATPKDGPSAGIAMAVALISLAKDVPVRAGLGFTGELTLSGRVLRIGGLREKALAARREGLTAVVFPRANASEWEEMEQAKPEPLVGPRVGLIGFPVSSLQDVVAIAFSTPSPP